MSAHTVKFIQLELKFSCTRAEICSRNFDTKFKVSTSTKRKKDIDEDINLSGK